MRIAKRLWRATIAAMILVALVCAWLVWTRAHPADSPFTELDLTQPIGMFTGRKIAALNGEFRQCRTLLFRAGLRDRALPPGGSNQCAYDDAVRLRPGGARHIGYRPARLDVSCPVAAGLAVWEAQVVQPAAERLLGSRVAQIDHYGSYSCRRIYGRSTGDWSEHARANAVDIAGFRLADGRRITVIRDWHGSRQDQAFLRTVRDGACRLFATVLSPDYNAAHRDHLHLDQADRGAMGWRACR
jgi:hypothetical protein